MRLERHQKIGTRLQKSRDEALGETLDAQNSDLRGMHQTVKQIAPRDRLVEDNDVQKGHCCFVSDVREILDALGASFVVEPRILNTASLQLHDANPVQQCRGVKSFEFAPA